MSDPQLRQAVLLCAAIGVLDFAQSIPLPLFPGFAQSRGADVTMIGLYGSMIGAAMTILGVPVGSLSDRVGRRLVVTGGAVLYAVVPVIFIFSPNPAVLLAGRFLQGLANGATFTLGFLWVSEIAPLENRPFIQGLYMSIMGLGYTLGPMVGGYAFSLWGYTEAFLVSTAFCLLAAGLFAVTLDSKPEQPREKTHVEFKELLGDRNIVAAGVVNVGNSVAFNALANFFPLYAASAGFSSADVGFAFMVRGLISTAIRFPVGAASKGGNALRIMTAGLLLGVISLVLFQFVSGLTWICILLGGLGAVYGILLTSGNVFITESSKPERRGASMGLSTGFGNAAGVIAPLLLGVIGQTFGITMVFVASAVVCVACLVVMLVLRRGDSKN